MSVALAHSDQKTRFTRPHSFVLADI